MSGDGGNLAKIGSVGMSLGLAPMAEVMGVGKQSKQRREILNQAYGDQRRSADAANGMVINEGANFQGATRQKAMDDQAAATLAQTQQDLAGASQGIDTAAGGGNVSNDFVKAKADRALTEGSRLTALAQEAAKLRAPGLQQATERQRRTDLMDRTGAMWSSGRGMTNAALQDAERVQEPWYGTLGRLGQQVALMYATRGGSGGGATPPQMG